MIYCWIWKIHCLQSTKPSKMESSPCYLTSCFCHPVKLSYYSIWCIEGTLLPHTNAAHIYNTRLLWGTHSMVVKSWTVLILAFTGFQEWKFMSLVRKSWSWNRYWSGLGIQILSLQLKHLVWKPQFRYFDLWPLIDRKTFLFAKMKLLVLLE